MPRNLFFPTLAREAAYPTRNSPFQGLWQAHKLPHHLQDLAVPPGSPGAIRREPPRGAIRRKPAIRREPGAGLRAGLLRPQARREPGAGLRAGLLRLPLGAPSERELGAGLRAGLLRQPLGAPSQREPGAGLRAGLLRRKTPGLGLLISNISR